MFGSRLGLPELLIVLVVFSIFPILTAVAWWKIFSKAGHPEILSLTMLIPAVNFFVLLWFAFSDWPIEKNLKAGE